VLQIFEEEKICFGILLHWKGGGGKKMEVHQLVGGARFELRKEKGKSILKLKFEGEGETFLYTQFVKEGEKGGEVSSSGHREKCVKRKGRSSLLL